jgi:hypothetical protein
MAKAVYADARSTFTIDSRSGLITYMFINANCGAMKPGISDAAHAIEHPTLSIDAAAVVLGAGRLSCSDDDWLITIAGHRSLPFKLVVVD